jgi:hypothetical protein
MDKKVSEKEEMDDWRMKMKKREILREEKGKVVSG